MSLLSGSVATAVRMAARWEHHWQQAGPFAGAFRKGYAACDGGKPLQVNPYRRRTGWGRVWHRAWRDGWLSCRAHQRQAKAMTPPPARRAA